MQINDSVLMTLFLTLCGLALLLVSLLVWKLLQQIQHSSTNQATLMLTLLDQQMMENQSLRNQLRSGVDLQGLHALNAATRVPEAVVESQSDSAYEDLPEEFREQEALRRAGYMEAGLSEDLNAAGWEQSYVPIAEQGGSPVLFDEQH